MRLAGRVSVLAIAIFLPSLQVRSQGLQHHPHILGGGSVLGPIPPVEFTLNPSVNPIINLNAVRSCSHPPVPLYAQVTLSDDILLRVGSSAVYRCDDGYELFGASTRICQSNGRWSGDLPYCAVNVAYGKPTNQSSTVRGGDSRNANDGDTTTLHENKYCTETKVESSPWWMIDLLQPYEVKVIRVLTRACCGHSPLHDLEVRVGNSSTVTGNRLCSWFPGTLDDGSSRDLICAHSIKGRYVFVQMVGVEASLSLCEVYVFTTKEFSSDRCGSRIGQDGSQSLIPFNQTCYEFQTSHGGSFSDATDYCKSRGGLMVNSVDNITHNFLYYELERIKNRLKSKLVWLGARRDLSSSASSPSGLHHPSFHRSRSNVWRWVDGQQVKDFLWAEDQPNNYNGQQNCIVLDGGRRWLWNDVTCDLDYLPWICQYNPSNCGSPDKNENTTILDTDFRIGKEITYKCPTGYAIEGAATRRCLPDGFWSESPPTCRFVDCGPLLDIPRGRVILVNQSRTSFNATAHYICDRDYTLVGNESRTCLSNGSWSGEQPKCMYSWCPELNLIPNGHLEVTNRTVNGTATYSCGKGHKLLGNETRRCELGGKWSGDEPVCRFIDCGLPLDVKNGRYHLLNSTSTYLSVVKYSCEPDYVLVGNETRNCSQHASWSGSEPICKLVDCGRPETPSGTEIVDRDPVFTVGSTVTVKCRPGHKHISGSEKRKCQQDGRWDGSNIECKFIECGRVPVILKGEVKYVNQTTHLDSIVNYTCSFGYRVVGSRVRVCRDDAKWSEASPKCEEIRCVPPEVPKNSSVTYSGNDRSTLESFKVGSSVQYRCATGHIVHGESLRSCDPDGQWTGQPPSCQFVDCGWPRIIPNGRWVLTTNSTFYGSTVEYECTNNFKISGPPRRLCLENGTWSGVSPSCETIRCGIPATKDDKTIVEGNSYQVGDKVHYSCQYGYELVGQETQTCETTGSWSHEVPFCRVVDCGRPPVLPNGRGYLLNSSTTYDSVIEYHCIPEFKLVGDPVRRCLATGSWSGSLPRCLEMSVINEMSENDIDSRADSSQSVNGAVNVHSNNLKSSKAIGIGIAIGIGALLVLIMTVAVVCLKTKKGHPVKSNHHHHHHHGHHNNHHHHQHQQQQLEQLNGHHHHLHHHLNHHNHHPIVGTSAASVDPAATTNTRSKDRGANGVTNGSMSGPQAMISYSRLSLESEAASSAHHMLPNGGSIRHHPNGLVTFCPPNGHPNNRNSTSNGHVGNSSAQQSGHNNLTSGTGTTKDNGGVAVSGSTISVAIRGNSPSPSMSSVNGHYNHHHHSVLPNGNGRHVMSTTSTIDV